MPSNGTLHFYPRSPCGERQPLIFSVQPRKTISIHALLAESDHPKMSNHPHNTKFLSTLSLRRATIVLLMPPTKRRGFLSTLSLRRATNDSTRRTYQKGEFLSTLSLRRATAGSVRGMSSRTISIHALLAESDISCAWSASKLGDFYPRSPCGERRKDKPTQTKQTKISIHALLAESDPRNWQKPHGQKTFLSTLSLRRATCAPSITPATSRNFYPRSPCGERQQMEHLKIPAHSISIHALLAESDLIASLLVSMSC